VAEEYPWERALGASVVDDALVEFRAWAPAAQRVAVRVRGADHELADEGYGVRSARVAASAGDDYWLVLDGSALARPRLALAARRAARALARRGPRRVRLDRSPLPRRGAARRRALRAARRHLHRRGHLRGRRGPARGAGRARHHARRAHAVAEFPGHHGWGYDGVYLSAAHSAYGGPHGLQRFVDAAHGAGIGVILDVVYNHVGASGVKALESFGPTSPSATRRRGARRSTTTASSPTAFREWVLQSATGWVRDFHVDGLRLDAIHAIHDDGARHVLRELADRVRAVQRRR
jgi:maltooligosyltrehalose trehalohydrolase